MKLKSLFFILPIGAMSIAPITLNAQEAERPAPARSLPSSSYSSWPVAEVEAIRETSKETFNVLDVNNSGSITLDEIDILQELIDGEETLSAEELADLRQRTNIISRTFMYVEEEIDQFEVADSDRDGTLSEVEFDQREASLRKHILQLNLDSFDTDKNGGVELSEFTAHLDDVEELDTDGDGILSRAELRGNSNHRLMQEIRVSVWQRQQQAERKALQSRSEKSNENTNR